ncbi:hypothetical protein D3C80_1863240 [compost metagenome]
MPSDRTDQNGNASRHTACPLEDEMFDHDIQFPSQTREFAAGDMDLIGSTGSLYRNIAHVDQVTVNLAGDL